MMFSPSSMTRLSFPLPCDAEHRLQSHKRVTLAAGKRQLFNMEVTPTHKASSGDAVSLDTPPYPCSLPCLVR